MTEMLAGTSGASVEAPSAVSLDVRVSTGFSAPTAAPGDVAGAARPIGWLGAPAVGGLTLPAAEPTPSQLYAPRGVWIDEHCVVAADTGNHRILIWHHPAPGAHAPADVVLGQPDFVTEGAQAGGRGPANGLRLPTGLIVHEGRLVVADAWNHRLLIWNRMPTESDTPADVVVGQSDRESVDENRGGGCGPRGFYWPFGLAMIGERLWVADTGNRRLVAWDGVPEPDQPPEVVVGQPDASSREENGGQLGSHSFRWPHDLASDGERMFVADAGNHRLLAWVDADVSVPTSGPTHDTAADLVFGQPDFETAGEFPYSPQSPTSLRFPYAIDILAPRADVDDDGLMVVADTANNRVLVWDSVATRSNAHADRVLGQHDFSTSGENRWDAVGHDTFCWPYGLSTHRALDGSVRVAVADSGNNRITIWTLR